MNVITKETNMAPHVQHHIEIVSGSGKWFELQDLHIDKILPEVLTLSEAYVQIYYRNIRGEGGGE